MWQTFWFHDKWGKVKVTLVQVLRFCTGRTAHRGSRDIALPFLDHGTRRGWGVSVTPRPLFTSGRDPAPIVQEAGWAPWPVWTSAENLASTGIRSPDRPARSQSLYRLSYPAHGHSISTIEILRNIFCHCKLKQVEMQDTRKEGDKNLASRYEGNFLNISSDYEIWFSLMSRL